MSGLRQLDNRTGLPTDNSTGLKKAYVVNYVSINLGDLDEQGNNIKEQQFIRVDYTEFQIGVDGSKKMPEKKTYFHKYTDTNDGLVKLNTWDTNLGAVIGDSIKLYLNTTIYGI